MRISIFEPGQVHCTVPRNLGVRNTVLRRTPLSTVYHMSSLRICIQDLPDTRCTILERSCHSTYAGARSQVLS